MAPLSKSVSGEQIVLPIGLTLQKSRSLTFNPSMADKLARNTSSYTAKEIATEIEEVI